MANASARTVINRPVSEVFAAIADITRMGEWSPECHAGRWVTPATGPALGAKFEGDNALALGPVTLKRWTTTSEVTAFEPGHTFEFVTEGYTTWRYELTGDDTSTTVTESFSYPPHTPAKKFLYDTLGRRSTAMVSGMQRTLDGLKRALEA